MNFIKRIFQKKEQDPSTEWCMTYFDSNSFRRDRVMDFLKEAGIEVKPSANHLLVKQDQYNQAMDVLKKHGY